MRKCNVCAVEINPERLEALPETTYCTEHSQYRAPLVLMAFDCKTNGVPVVIDRNGTMGSERERIARRAYRRAR